ncbi:hypothetical protein JCM19241_921 [Vibrio ishigakensis]|uniref:Uncharacterized protein n=1 Tax=Vibrio ishigakensis TaxID=1481914 RepID=A0A0B8QH82_9VIBR|nr:hypothetical protein JCM19241_921 [Vibrio ishigakensis]
MKLKSLALLIPVLSAPAFANPVEEALKKDGAQVNLLIKTAKEAPSPEFIDSARNSFDNFHWQMGGDHAMYYNSHMNEFLTTAISSPNAEYKPLERAINSDLDELKVETTKVALPWLIT